VKDWQIDVLTNAHNGDNDAEVERIRAEHPDEAECVINRRVLGALAPTRCECSVFFRLLCLGSFLLPPRLTCHLRFSVGDWL
jgi:hypothetical protein